MVFGMEKPNCSTTHEVPARYFKNDIAIWKFVPGQRPQLRTPFSDTWKQSIFATLESFLKDPQMATEIPAEEGEIPELATV